MPTTNAVQFNPSQANQLSDGSYDSDSLLTGGFPGGGTTIIPSNFVNKLFYQLTTYITALANALVIKGFTNADTSLATLTAVFENILTTADFQVPNGQQITASTGTTVIDLSLGTIIELTLGTNTTVSFNNIKPFQTIILTVFQSGSSSYTCNFPLGFFPNNPVSSTLGSTTTITYITRYNASSGLQDAYLSSVVVH